MSKSISSKSVHFSAGRARTRLHRALAAALPGTLLATALAGGIYGGDAAAATYQVTNTDDAGPGSLRDALDQANASTGVADIITFDGAVTGTITLTSGSLYAMDPVDIQGPGAELLTIDGSGLASAPNNASTTGKYGSGVILITGQPQPQVQGNGPPPTIPVTVSGVTMTGASSSAIAAKYTDLSVSNATITGNGALESQSTPGGGGILSIGGSLVVSNSRITENSAKYGGGLMDAGPGDVIIENSLIAGNQAYGGAGASIGGNNVSITGSTISGNQAVPQAGQQTLGTQSSYCGGLMVGSKYDVPVIVANSTISGNQADGGGGLCAQTSVDISFSTITDNSATQYGGGIIGSSPARAARIGQETLGGYSYSITVRNSVVAGNSAPSNPDLDPGAAPVTIAYSLIGDPGTATYTDGGGVITGEDPMLGPLADNGGPTPTHEPLENSPLINAGDPAFAGPPATDQRGAGFPRIVDGVVDIGAIERAATGVPPPVAVATPVPGLGVIGKLGLGALLGLLGMLGLRRRLDRRGPA